MRGTMLPHKALASALLRLTQGVAFLLYGVGKFRGGLSSFAGGLEQRCAEKFAPRAAGIGYTARCAVGLETT